MDDIFDYAVLGGGIIGISVAASLAKNEKLKVSLFEKNKVGLSGATKDSGGIIRAFDFNSYHSLLTLLSLELHNKRRDDMDFVNDGHLYILPKKELHRIIKTLKLFLKFRYPFDLLDSTQAKKLTTELNFKSSEIAIWEPLGGYASPQKMALVLKNDFLQLNGNLFENIEIENIYKDNNGITNIISNNNNFKAKKIIICMGAGNRNFMGKHNMITQNKLIEIIKCPINFETKITFNDYVTGLYSRPLIDKNRIIGLPQNVFNIDPYVERAFNMSFFENSECIKERINGYENCENCEITSTADSYTNNLLPQIKVINKSWILVDGLNGSGFKMYPILTEFIKDLLKKI
nr:FAD-dependent oxidoreductase [uncultured Flavobacterium sp.]